MKIVEYRDWTQKQRDLAQKIWVKHLDKFCPVVRPKEYGCRPCDLGCSCDRCQYDYDFNLEVVLDVIDGIKITKQTFGEALVCLNRETVFITLSPKSWHRLALIVTIC